MSLLGPWPATAGLPEPQEGPAREHARRELEALVEAKLALLEAGEGPAPVDVRVEDFLTRHLASVRDGRPVQFPAMLGLHRHGMARLLSLPRGGDSYESPLLRSYRCHNGVLHNPAKDKRTTVGVFHVAEGGLPIAEDKKAVPLAVFSRLLDAALAGVPASDLELPYTTGTGGPARRAWVRVLLRPLVCPEVPGYASEKRMEVRFVAPGSMVANVDFVESVFGNAGDAALPENDAALDAEHWSGHTGCVILAPHLLRLTKKELGLPNWHDATERQRRDGMAWKDPGERYNDGSAFKICVRTGEGVFVTLLADNYFGYCKKEVKTQLSFACNLFGTEEEHSGGALAFASMSWGSEFRGSDKRVQRINHHCQGRVAPAHYTFAEALQLLGDQAELRPEGYAVDKQFADIIYVPENSVASIGEGKISWEGGEVCLEPGFVFVHPSGYQVALKKSLDKTDWHIVGTVAEPVNCHKPSTVSGGGKSEISKLLSDMITFATVRIDNVKRDLAYVDLIIKRNYSDRYPCGRLNDYAVLDPRRSLGSIVKLLTPNDDYTSEYNSWLETIPPMIRTLVFVVKHYYQPSWGKDWKSHIGVHVIDGREGDIVYVDGRRVVVQCLRVGRMPDGRDRKFQLRYDFAPAQKIQTEDDITASTVVPSSRLQHLSPEVHNPSLKLAQNCELRLFQRPDDAVIRGYDTRCEADMAGADNFMSNFEPLTSSQADELTKRPVEFDRFTEPMRKRLKVAADSSEGGGARYVVSSAHFRIVDGKPTANPRYLQVRTDFTEPHACRVAHVAACLRRRAPVAGTAHFPVNGVLPGRRNNPPDHLADGTPIRPLAVFNPLHYQELPELFMDFVCSLTGKSPSTTGAGSEGALTKSPFNALTYTADLNGALVGMILCGYAGFSSAAGYIGRRRVDHDISLLVPELWCRMSEEERDPAYLIQHNCLEKVEDLDINGKTVLASRLGYRITKHFAHRFLSRIFNSPSEVFDDALLRPEVQDLAMFVDGVNNIVEAQAKTARAYIADGSIAHACPPLRALLYIMAEGCTPEGHTMESPAFRELFTRENLLASSWYRQRLLAKHRQEITRRRRSVEALRHFMKQPSNKDHADRLRLNERLATAERSLAEAESPAFVETLVGTAGAEPLLESLESQRAHA